MFCINPVSNQNVGIILLRLFFRLEMILTHQFLILVITTCIIVGLTSGQRSTAFSTSQTLSILVDFSLPRHCIGFPLIIMTILASLPWYFNLFLFVQFAVMQAKMIHCLSSLLPYKSVLVSFDLFSYTFLYFSLKYFLFSLPFSFFPQSMVYLETCYLVSQYLEIGQLSFCCGFLI